MFVLKGILRAESQEKILIYLMLRSSGYGKGIAEFFGLSQNTVQKQLIRMEDDGVVVSHLIGRLREYRLNPRYAFLTPMKELLKVAMEAYPETVIQSLLMTRNKPRGAGKPPVSARL
ncbi:winged helix-turn-helix domain-containing protein [uncultured Endozoicomonas sp.]|uniref:winged helix-turn-helix domain-containing protein n=1 Tax=uncultured Endozoicomonas sp. TaxID=432652 RepID=UPI00260E5591|nr:winged helix-turn-helix domain-containing protein [uncultured Endozoicomonas sp.]